MIAFKMYSQTKNHTIFTDCVITEFKFYGHTNMKNNTHKSIEHSKKNSTTFTSNRVKVKLSTFQFFEKHNKYIIPVIIVPLLRFKLRLQTEKSSIYETQVKNKLLN